MKALVSTVAAAMAGIAAGTAVGGLAALMPPATRAAVVTLAAATLAATALLKSRPVQLDRETPAVLLHHGPLVWAAANGALLGFGPLSRIGFWLWYMVPIGVILSGSALVGGAIWGTYGMTRLMALSYVARQIRRQDSSTAIPGRLLQIHERVRKHLRIATVIAAVITCVAVGV